MTWQSFQTFANFTFAKVVIWLRGSTITASQSCTPASHRQAGRVPRSDPARWACTMETGTGARHRPEGAASKVRSSSGFAVGPDDGTPETLEAPRQNGSGLPGPPPCGCAALQPSGRRSLPRAYAATITWLRLALGRHFGTMMTATRQGARNPGFVRATPVRIPGCQAGMVHHPSESPPDLSSPRCV